MIGMNLTYGPMHVVGVQGQPRRTYTYEEGYGWDFWNMVETIGAFIIALSVLVFLWNIGLSYKRHVKAGRPAEVPDPWDARSLEWLTPNPTPHHNFDEIPTVTHLDEFWHRKYAEDERGRPVAIAPAADVVQPGTAHPHLPAQSYWPIVLAFGMPIVAYGLIFNLALALVGGVMILTAIYGWSLEPAFEGGHGNGHHDGDGGGNGDGDHGAEAEAPAAETETEETEGAPVG
jgi:cytochrome c oxidase subunit 1